MLLMMLLMRGQCVERATVPSGFFGYCKHAYAPNAENGVKRWFWVQVYDGHNGDRAAHRTMLNME